VIRLDLEKQIRKLENDERGSSLQRFFKTGNGEYGEGDVFLGLVSAQIGEFVRKYCELPVRDCIKLLHSKYHEERMVALQILVSKFKKADLAQEKKEIFEVFINNTAYINNWDLIDVNVPYVIGEYLYDRDKAILYSFAKSESLWERRIAIISTLAFIKRGMSKETVNIAKMLLNDTHDLIHKAVGWMLREVGKRCDEKVLTNFLDTHATKMPRTMLRYSMERLPKDKYYYYLKLKN